MWTNEGRHKKPDRWRPLQDFLKGIANRRAQPLNPKLGATIAFVATLGVVLAAIWAWQSSELTLASLSWWPIVLAFAATAPASLALRAAEFHLSARLAGQQPTAGKCIKVALASSVANLLPIPGSFLVSVRAISQDGSKYGTAITVSAVPGLCWLFVTGVVGGVAMSIAGPAWLGAITGLIGLLAGFAALNLFQRSLPLSKAEHPLTPASSSDALAQSATVQLSEANDRLTPTSSPDTLAQSASVPLSEVEDPPTPPITSNRKGLGVAIVVVECAWLVVSAARIILAVTALGLSITVAQALALSVAGALTVAVGFFPAGLGLKEALIAGLSPIIGLPLDIGVLLGAVDRGVWLAFLATASAIAVLLGAIASPQTKPKPKPPLGS